MSSSQDDFAAEAGLREARENAAHAPSTPTPLFELALGDGSRASPDVVDLDPPTYFPPQAER